MQAADTDSPEPAFSDDKWIMPFAAAPAGYRGVMTTFGNPSNDIMSEGLHFRLPLAQRLNLVNVSIRRGEGEDLVKSVTME